jgi:hypothetical protein
MQDQTEFRQFLLDNFEYRDGHLYWKEIIHKRNVNKPAGHINGRGYRIISIWNKETKKYKTYLMHRMTFLMHHGYLPKVLDHIDGNQANNNIDNLREATLSQNMYNRKISSNNSSGYKGVKWSNQKKKYIGVIKMGLKEHYVGSFKIAEDAAKAVMELREKLQGEFARHK